MNDVLLACFQWLKERAHPVNKTGDPQGDKRIRYSVPELPEEIWHNIHSLLPLPDAARAGCVSRTFLNFWRCHPYLIFSRETLGLNGNACGGSKVARIFINRVDSIMRRHSGIGVKTFQLRCFCSDFNPSYLNRWLQIAITPGIEKLELRLPASGMKYNFPCSLLFSGNGNSIRHLKLVRCGFHPTTGLGCLRTLFLSQVNISGDQLGYLLSNSLALEKLYLSHCKKIICLKIPWLLHRLSSLTVLDCALEVLENKAPNLRKVCVDGALIKLPLGDLLQVRDLTVFGERECNFVHYARAKLPSIVPNLETLSISSASEMFSTPIVPVKFLHLKSLRITFDVALGAFSPAYDYFSLACFLDACPVLETFKLHVSQTRVKHDLISGDSLHLRQMPEQCYGNIKNVKIIGFCSAKSMVELTCHILENATSLECLTLDTICDNWGEHADRTRVHKIGECFRVDKQMIREALKGLVAIERYVVGKVPPTVKLNVKKPCNLCHVVK
ncbi:hypothetical protein BRADI_3g38590v3 [Brachypodium distachyon]|uniref:Uncharacterized protein n=1 Tax=Brachypodium distachyon TaxID=15368 RepID=I1I800_BRADI|nr:hypothetical protein BRADI_3g38590v3 [Brachypodium distachyon]